MKAALSHLTVFTGPVCNLDCSYCYARAAEPAPRAPARLLSSLGLYLADAPAGARVTFLGGEPLLDGPLLRRAVSAVRAARPELPMRVFTNGTLLNAGWLAFFRSRAVSLVVSLDGGAAVNDACRRFRRGRASVFATVLRRLPRRQRAAVTVSMAVTPAAAGRLDESVRELAALGFRSLAWAPDSAARWNAAALAALRGAAGRVKLAYFRAVRTGAAPYEIANVYEALAAEVSGLAVPLCSNLTLAWDGTFYPCDKLLSAPAAFRARFAMGPDRGRVAAAGRGRFFKAAAGGGAAGCAGPCQAGAWALAGGRPGWAAGRLAAGKFTAGWLASMARAGLKFGPFRRQHLPGGGARP